MFFDSSVIQLLNFYHYQRGLSIMTNLAIKTQSAFFSQFDQIIRLINVRDES
jgi:hypothetical protein